MCSARQFEAKANESLQVLVAATAVDGSSEQAGEAAVFVLSDSEQEEKKPAVECRMTRLTLFYTF